MNEAAYAIERIEIEQFKKIRDLVLEPSAGANILFGGYRSGKTSVCEFIRFALYGAGAVSFPKGTPEDALGTLLFRRGESLFCIRRSLVGGKESLSFTDDVTGKNVDTDLTPGQYLLGLDQSAYDVIAYFRQSRYEAPIFRPDIAFLDQIASFQPETENIYRDYLSLKTKAENYTNDEKTGSLDKLEKGLEDISRALDQKPALAEKIHGDEAVLDEINAHIDENEKRCVLIKADMANYEDDLKLSRNKENAAELKRQIQAKEKRLRMLKYEVSNKEGALNRAETDGLKRDYNRFSLALTELGDARNSLASAQETLAFHESLFNGRDSADHYDDEWDKIRNEKKKRLSMNILGVVLIALGLSLGFLLFFLNFDVALCLATAGALALCGVAAFVAGRLNTLSIRRILAENGRKDLEDFEDFREKLKAHTKTTQIYQDAVAVAEKKCAEKQKAADEIRGRINQKLHALGHQERGEDLLAACDEIIASNEGAFELEDEIRGDWSEYLARLAKDVERDSLEVSPEFDALQKELIFLSKQSESLTQRRDAVMKELTELRAYVRDADTLLKEKARLEEALRGEQHSFEVIKMDLALAEANKRRFETGLKDALTAGINRRLSFLLKEGESFLFDEHFELCYRDHDSVLPVLSIGGGQLAELGLFAFRLGLAELLNKNDLPMIFDDPFSYCGTEEIRHLYGILKECCGQFLLSTASREVIDLCDGSARILAL
ncbi:MAG: AAA family ATPase [Clostridia bacterium]|nr:AAA family ATPase [Clostridia bacterium]